MAQRSKARTRDAALRTIENQLRNAPHRLDLLYERARLLDAMGRTAEAEQAYIATLQRDARHFDALIGFGLLLYRAGATADARTAFAAAATAHPSNPIGHANLGYTYLKTKEFEQARKHYEAALDADPRNVEAHRGLAIALEQLGQSDAAKTHREAGHSASALTTLPYRGSAAPINALLLVTTTPGNVNTDRFFDDRTFALTKIVCEYYADEPLPQHSLIFNALGDPDVCTTGLNVASRIVERSGARTLNHPSAVLNTGRAQNAGRLSKIRGIRTARTELLPRAEISGAGFSYPLLLRSPGFHTGENFVKVDSPLELPAAIIALPGEQLLVMEFLDVRRGAQYRKYRVLIVDGALYPLHLAISEHWKVHYFSADMQDKGAHRNEEAAFLNDMEAALGEKAMRALHDVATALELDYGGIDFALDADGNVAVYEANATMIVREPPPDAMWDYRRKAVDRINDAVQRMLTK